MTAELSGFKKVVARRASRCSIGDRLEVSLTLDVGRDGGDRVGRRPESPLLDDDRPDRPGRSIGEKTIAMMPLSDGNPFALARLAPGIAYNGDLKFSRPFDNGGTSGIVTGGATGGNEFTLDGSPNMANGRRVAFVPPAGAVQEFKVETASFDAASGHTAGATVNVTLKSGTNALKGSGYTYYRSEKLAETDFFVKKAGRAKPKLGYKRPGFTIGGPVVIPGYNGHDKTFFFAAIEWLYDEFPEPLFQTVPTQAMRNGDFSALLSHGILIYDPLTGADRRRHRGRPAAVRGQHHSGEPHQPDRPERAELLSAAESAGGRRRPQDNFFYANPRTDDFYSWSTRVDHTITSKQRLMARYTRNDRREARNAQLGDGRTASCRRGNFLFRKNDGVTVNHTWTQTQHRRCGTSAPAGSGSASRTSGSTKASSIRRRSDSRRRSSSLFGGAQYFPLFDFDTIQRHRRQPGRQHDAHDLLVPADLHASCRATTRCAPATTCACTTSSARTRAAGRRVLTQTAQRIHAARTTSRGAELPGRRDASCRVPDRRQHRPATARGRTTRGITRFFVQDDWKMSSKLTLNLGLRYDYEGAPTEVRTTATCAASIRPRCSRSRRAAEAAYAARPDVVPASQWRARGGVQFASDGTPRFLERRQATTSSRASGFAYTLNERTVLRGGMGHLHGRRSSSRTASTRWAISQVTPYHGVAESTA